MTVTSLSATQGGQRKGAKGDRGEERKNDRKEGEKGRDGKRRDAGTCVSHGLPIATHAANARVIGASYRPLYIPDV